MFQDLGCSVFSNFNCNCSANLSCGNWESGINSPCMEEWNYVAVGDREKLHLSMMLALYFMVALCWTAVTVKFKKSATWELHTRFRPSSLFPTIELNSSISTCIATVLFPVICYLIPGIKQAMFVLFFLYPV